MHNISDNNIQRSKPEKPARLPLPKNMVLMSLIESSEMAKSSSYLNTKKLLISSSNEDEDKRILMGTDITTSTCGTYVVRKSDGLKLVQKISAQESVPTDTSWKKDMESIVPKCAPETSTMLNCGDRVQVVNIVNNWAKLARGYGYIFLENATDLVKIGGPLDKACSMEAWMYTLSRSRDRLIQAQNDVENDALSLMNRLRKSLEVDEDVTVVAAEAFRSNERRDGDESSRTQSNPSSNESCVDLIRQGDPDGPIEVVLPSNQSNFLQKALSSIRHIDSNAQKIETRDDDTSSPRQTTRLYSPNAVLAGAQEWRRRNGRQESRRVIIDFRTGKSCHNGVSKSHIGHMRSSSDAFHHSTHNIQDHPKMSSHCALTSSRRRTSMNTGFSFDW
jgi:flagellar hook-associated protein FlgK